PPPPSGVAQATPRRLEMPSVNMLHARTLARSPALAADELCARLGTAVPKLVVMFASRDRDHVALNRALRERLPKGTRLVGATTGGEIDRDGMHSGSVVIAALNGDLEAGLGLGRDLTRNAPAAGETAIREADRQHGARPPDRACLNTGA